MKKAKKDDAGTIRKGQYFLLSSGEYSDFEIHTVCVALEDLDIFVLQKEYLRSFPKEIGAGEFKKRRFLRWLMLHENLLKEIDYCEWHLSDYESIEEMNLWVFEEGE